MLKSREMEVLQGRQANVRNICILAHVDHGKTTLSDYLVSSNGVINPKSAGKLRYLDSRADEQERLITMKSSSIALLFKYESREDALAKTAPVSRQQGEAQEAQDAQDAQEQAAKVSPLHLVNLIDSPGHVDFSSEVSNAVRFSDGALVLVDVLEGLCVQTQAVLQQAWREGTQPVLVLNKMDRLVTELKLTPMDAYQHLVQLLERINAFTSTFVTADAMADHGDSDARESQFVDIDESRQLTFSPELDNVIFASAFDGWGFSVADFAFMFGAKMGMNPVALKRALWGDFFYIPKHKKVVKKPQGKYTTPMFVQVVLENIWRVYEGVLLQENPDLMAKIIKTLGLKIPHRELATSDWRVRTQAILSRWLPVSKAVLTMVVEKLPSPLDAQRVRAARIWPGAKALQIADAALAAEGQQDKSPELLGRLRAMVDSVHSCNLAAESDVLVFVAKMVDMSETSSKSSRAARERDFAAERRALKQQQRRMQAAAAAGADPAAAADAAIAEEQNAVEEEEEEEEEEDRFIAFARVYSGTLDVSDTSTQTLYVFGPKYNPDDPSTYRHRRSIPARKLKLLSLMGRDTMPLTKVPAGSICGIEGLSKLLLNVGTLSTMPDCVPFTPMRYQAQPIVRVAIEPRRIRDMPALVHGLKLLHQADPNVRVFIQETGEHVLVTSGEIHLERCLRDLKDRFARGIDVRVSKPLVEFRETIVATEDDEEKQLALRQRIDEIQKLIAARESAAEDEQAERDAEGEEEDDDGDGSDSAAGEADDEVPDLADTEDPLLVELEELRSKIFLQSGATPNGRCRVSVRAVPLPERVRELLIKRTTDLRQMAAIHSAQRRGKQITRTRYLSQREDEEGDDDDDDDEQKNDSGEDEEEDVEEAAGDAQEEDSGSDEDDDDDSQVGVAGMLSLRTFVASFETQLRDAFAEADGDWPEDTVDQILSLGPRRYGPNVLLNRTPGLELRAPLLRRMRDELRMEPGDHNARPDGATRKLTRMQESSIVNGFQLVTTAGPLCAEPLAGVCFVLEQVEVEEVDDTADPYGPMSGQIMSTVSTLCHRAFLARSVRLMEALYRLEMQCTTEHLGKLYGLLQKRRGQILDEDMLEGSSYFVITAYLPVAESFGFAKDIRTRTSGAASPQLLFSHWRVMEQDPFWQPTTEDEIEDYGGEVNKDQVQNIVRDLIDAVRKRKGLSVEAKVVEHAEKQRTLSKKK